METSEKRVSQLQTGLTLGKKYEDRELVRRPYLRVANVQDGYLDLNTITEVESPAEEVKRYELQRGEPPAIQAGPEGEPMNLRQTCDTAPDKLATRLATEDA